MEASPAGKPEAQGPVMHLNPDTLFINPLPLIGTIMDPNISALKRRGFINHGSTLSLKTVSPKRRAAGLLCVLGGKGCMEFLMEFQGPKCMKKNRPCASTPPTQNNCNTALSKNIAWDPT